MGRISEHPVSAMEGENRLVYEFIPLSRIGSNRRSADGVRVEKFPGFTTLQILAEIQNVMTEIQCEPEQFPGRIIFMPMYSDIVREGKGWDHVAEDLMINFSESRHSVDPVHWNEEF